MKSTINAEILNLLRLGVFLTDASIMSKLRADGFEPGASTVSSFMSGLRTGKISPPTGYVVEVRKVGRVTSTSLIKEGSELIPVDVERLLQDVRPSTLSMNIQQEVTDVEIKISRSTNLRVVYY